MNVSWELTVADRFGRRHTFQQSRACFYDASLIVCWSGGGFPGYRHFSGIQLHAVRRQTARSPGDRKLVLLLLRLLLLLSGRRYACVSVRSCWRSLLSELQVKPRPDQVVGKDQLISLVHASGFLVGVWRVTAPAGFARSPHV